MSASPLPIDMSLASSDAFYILAGCRRPTAAGARSFAPSPEKETIIKRMIKTRALSSIRRRRVTEGDFHAVYTYTRGSRCRRPPRHGHHRTFVGRQTAHGHTRQSNTRSKLRSSFEFPNFFQIFFLAIVRFIQCLVCRQCCRVDRLRRRRSLGVSRVSSVIVAYKFSTRCFAFSFRFRNTVTLFRVDICIC